MRLGTVERYLELDQVRVDNALNPRQGALDQDVVFDYSAHVDELPPMAVFEIGGEYLLVAGFHRYAAYRLAQRGHGRFVVHQGTREEAKEFADLDNLKHGKNLTRVERREVIRRQLKRHPEWSDVRLALACCTSDKTVRAVREEMERSSEIPRMDVLVGTDGIERPRTAPRPAAQPQPPAPELLTPVAELEERYQITSQPSSEPAPWEMSQVQAAAGLARLAADLKAAGTPLTDAVMALPVEDKDIAINTPEIYEAMEQEQIAAGLAEDDDAGEDVPDETGDDPDAVLEIEAEAGQELRDEAPDPGPPPPPPPPLPPPPLPVVTDAPWQITLTVRGEASPLLMLMRGGAMEKYLPEAVARRVIAAVEAAIEPAAELLEVSNQ